MLPLNTIIQEVYDRMSVDQDNTTYGTWTRVVPKINSVMHRILSDRKFDVLNQDSTYHPYIKGGDLQFLRATHSFSRRPNKIISRPAVEGEQRVYIGTPLKVPAKGWVLIKGTVFKFTLYSNDIETYLQLDEQLQIDVEAGVEIEFLYQIPTNAEATYQLFSLVNNKEMEMIYSDYRYQSDFKEYWTILYKNGYSLIRIVAPETRYYSTFKLNYYNKVSDLTSLTDKTLFPEERFDRDVLALLVAGELLYETERSEDANVKLNEGYGNLVLFYDKYATTNKGFRQDMGRNRNLQRNVSII